MQGPIHVIGIGLDGAKGLSALSRSVIEQAAVLVGSDRHLSYFPDHPAQRIRFGNLQEAIASVNRWLATAQVETQHPAALQSADTKEPMASAFSIVILVSGDPLFFGLGRLLLKSFSPGQLTFYPHVSSVQLAFNRLKMPWHDATIVSLHGRMPDELIPALKKGQEKIAVLTDGVHTPEAIARLIQSLALAIRYRVWVCENLGDPQERIQSFAVDELAGLQETQFAALNVVILVRQVATAPQSLEDMPIVGIADQHFASFSDRPGLMTKREVRTLIMGELHLQPHQVIWDIGAGTGSVSIEAARLNPTATLYAIEKTAIGARLIKDNLQRFKVENVIAIHGSAPEAMVSLPAPDRVFLGGSGGHLCGILNACGAALNVGGLMVIAVATLEHQAKVMQWLEHQRWAEQTVSWTHHILSIQLSRSMPIGSLTRLNPLNPVTVLTLKKGQD